MTIPNFNSLPVSLFTTDNISLSRDTYSSIPFHQPLLQSFIQHTMPLDLQVGISIINPHHSISTQQLVSSNIYFNGWFGIPFQDELHNAHIRTPQPSEILILYNLHTIIPLYPSLLSESIIRQLVLHILPSCLVQELSTIIPLPNLVQYVPSSHHKYISYCFYLQPMPCSSIWKDVYTANKYTTIIM